MGRFPSDVSLREVFRLEREGLKMALQGKIKCGMTDEGFEWCPADKEEAHAVIWEIFRNAEYWALEMAACARALERVAEKYGVGISSDHFREYIAFKAEETSKE